MADSGCSLDVASKSEEMGDIVQATDSSSVDPKEKVSNSNPDDNGEAKIEPKGQKRSSENNEVSPSKKKKKAKGYQHRKNALMHLNELKPGLKYIFESQQGPAHDPVFVVHVVVNDEKFIGKGKSKQLAKHAAAEAALASIVQFQNMPEAMIAMSKHISNADFTADNVENEASIFNKFEQQKNGSDKCGTESSALMHYKLSHKLRKIITEADKKSPVMLLNELRPGLTYTLVRENATMPSQRFVMQVTVDDEPFEGVGQNKRAAKAAAARCVLSKRYGVSFNIPPIPAVVSPDVYSFPQPTADKIAKCISDVFKDIMVGNPDHAEWDVLAGIVMTRDEAMEDMQVIGIGTGTKHLNGENMSMNGASLNDCHAEVICRRCVKDFLYTQLESYVEGEGDLSIFEKKQDGKFTLKPHHKFHLFISTSPCGDARASADGQGTELVDHQQNPETRGLLQTKIGSGEGTIPVKLEQSAQNWNAILKGQNRYLTMSCSDKIASWNVLGLQGSLLSYFMDPVYLESIILGGLFHHMHYIYHAVCGRLKSTLGKLPSIYHLNEPKLGCTATLETTQAVKSPEFSVNWSAGLGRPEIIITKTGKQESGQVSRLAKRSFFQRYSNLHSILFPGDSETPPPRMYSAVKSLAADYCASKRELLKAFSTAGLRNWVKKPLEQDEFDLAF